MPEEQQYHAMFVVSESRSGLCCQLWLSIPKYKQKEQKFLPGSKSRCSGTANSREHGVNNPMTVIRMKKL